MSGVLNLCDVLQLIINRFYQSTLSQQDFISYAHHGVLHVALHFGYQSYAVREEILEQGLSYIPLIRTEFALDIL